MRILRTNYIACKHNYYYRRGIYAGFGFDIQIFGIVGVSVAVAVVVAVAVAVAVVVAVVVAVFVNILLMYFRCLDLL
jgi:hypothetical protein